MKMVWLARSLCFRYVFERNVRYLASYNGSVLVNTKKKTLKWSWTSKRLSLSDAESWKPVFNLGYLRFSRRFESLFSIHNVRCVSNDVTEVVDRAWTRVARGAGRCLYGKRERARARHKKKSGWHTFNFPDVMTCFECATCNSFPTEYLIFFSFVLCRWKKKNRKNNEIRLHALTYTQRDVCSVRRTFTRKHFVCTSRSQAQITGTFIYQPSHSFRVENYYYYYASVSKIGTASEKFFAWGKRRVNETHRLKRWCRRFDGIIIHGTCSYRLPHFAFYLRITIRRQTEGRRVKNKNEPC